MTKTKFGWLIYALAILALIGLLDATYLTASHLTNTAVTCSLFEGCDIVLSSKYAEIAGIPTALYGAAFYFLVFAGATIGLITSKRSIIVWTARFTTLGFLASLFLLHLQVFVIGSLCQFCMISVVTSTLLFITGLFFLFGKGGLTNTSSLNELETQQ